MKSGKLVGINLDDYINDYNKLEISSIKNKLEENDSYGKFVDFMINKGKEEN